jgi:adenylate cyclase
MDSTRFGEGTGDPDGAIALLREATDDLFDAGQFAYCVAAIKLLVETLLARGDDADIREAELALNRLATAPFDDEFVLPVITLLRLRALLAQAHGDEVSYRDFATRYRKFASDFGFEGHMALAEAMT